MKYQLVLQFGARSTSDFDHLVAFEEKLQHQLDSSSTLDGHDFGVGEFNIFVLTDDPTAAFQRARALFASEELKHDMRAAYRKVAGDSFVILWPPDLMEFTVS